MTFITATKDNILFFSLLSGMPAISVQAWLELEGQQDNNPTNPFNILYYGSAHPMQIGKFKTSYGTFGLYYTAKDGMRDAWGILHHLNYKNVMAAIATHDPRKVSRAIELSPWAGKHYGATPSKLGSVSLRTNELLTKQALPPLGVKPLSTGVNAVDEQTTAIATRIKYCRNLIKAGNLNIAQYNDDFTAILTYANTLARMAAKALTTPVFKSNSKELKMTNRRPGGIPHSEPAYTGEDTPTEHEIIQQIFQLGWQGESESFRRLIAADWVEQIHAEKTPNLADLRMADAVVKHLSLTDAELDNAHENLGKIRKPTSEWNKLDS